MTQPDLRDVARAGLSRIDVFAEHLVGRPLWPHQLDMALSPARYRVACAGRQVGKSRLLAIEALFQGFSTPESLTLIVSAGDVAARRLLEECADLALSSLLLAGAVLDDHRTQITLSNGSRIISVPASQRQIRGWSVDLLILDEAGFIDPEIWRAAEPAIIARPGSRVILSSSPWGKLDHFFRQLWNMGTVQPDKQVASFHWPSSVSPMISQDDLDRIQAREAPHYFDREYLAKWTDESGAYFKTEEIDNAVADYQLIDPAESNGRHYVVGGIDWGMSDANAVVYLAAQSDHDLNDAAHGSRPIFFIPWLEANYQMAYTEFIDRLVDHATGFAVGRFISETNGVGQYPTQRLSERINSTHLAYADEPHPSGHGWRTRHDIPGGLQTNTWVYGMHTDNRRKSSGFGRIKGLLQEGRLVLPRNADLMRQLHSLTYEQTPSGDFKISVPENVGHDDLAMALMQAASCIFHSYDGYDPNFRPSAPPIVETLGGTKISATPGTIWDLTLFGSGPKHV